MTLDLLAKPMVDVSAQEILESHFSLAHVPNEIKLFEIDGVQGWTSPNSHPVLSIGTWSTTDADIAAGALDKVLSMFRDAGRGFDWMTGPDHAHLLPLLEERGFISPPLTIAAMARHLSAEDRADDPAGITTQKIDGVHDDKASLIMALGFDIPDDVGRLYHNAYVQRSDLQKTDVYTASVAGQAGPIGIGYQSYIGDGPLVLLRVAATLPGHRGLGVYRALIKRRLADAAAAGRTVAVVHAYSKGSQTALTELGFKTEGALTLHRWRP